MIITNRIVHQPCMIELGCPAQQSDVSHIQSDPVTPLNITL